MKMNKIVIFKIDNEEYAADITEVERILGYTEPTKIPEAPSFVRGVIKYQDIILPIIDLKERFHLSHNDKMNEAKIIVVKNESKYIGLIVDMVSEVIDISSENIDEAPDIVKSQINRYVSGMVKIGNRIIILLDTNKIVSMEEIIELNSIPQ